MTEDDPFRFDDGPYVMGALSQPDRAAFEAHLRTCPECALRVDELRPLIDALAGIDPAELDADPVIEPVPDTLLPQLIRRVDGQRRRQRWVLSGLAAATAACVIALVVAFWPGSSSGPGHPTPGATVHFQAVAAAPVDATAVLTAKKWGTRVDLQCKVHAIQGGSSGGYGDGGTYHLVIVARDGSKFDAGGWGENGADVNYVTGTALTPNQIAMMQIVAQDGTVLLTVKL